MRIGLKIIVFLLGFLLLAIFVIWIFNNLQKENAPQRFPIPSRNMEKAPNYWDQLPDDLEGKG